MYPLHFEDNEIRFMDLFIFFLPKKEKTVDKKLLLNAEAKLNTYRLQLKISMQTWKCY